MAAETPNLGCRSIFGSEVKRLRVGPKVGPTALLIKFTTFKHNYDNTNTGFNIIAVPVQA